MLASAHGNTDNDFYSTAKLVGVDLFDSQGMCDRWILSLSSASGVNYLAAPVPEPATSVLFGMGLLALARCNQARRAPRT